MKKILFATTALVATAGVASAEVSLTGFAEMGIVGGDYVGNTTQFHSDIDVTFNLSGEADNGLTFGATIDLDEATDPDYNSDPTDGGNDKTASLSGEGESDMSVFVAYGGAKLTMGDTDGAFDWAMKEAGFGGSIADDHTTHAGFNFNSGLDGMYDGQIVRFDYSFDAFSVALSTAIDDTGAGDPVWGLGFKYSADLSGIALGVGIGYQTVDPVGVGDTSVAGISLDAAFSNGLAAVLNYSSQDDSTAANNDWDHWGLGVAYTMNALTVEANYGEYDYGGGMTDSGYGLAVNYDLGGGLVVQAGYGYSDADVGGINRYGAGTNDSFSLGLAMSF